MMEAKVVAAVVVVGRHRKEEVVQVDSRSVARGEGPEVHRLLWAVEEVA